MRTTLTQYTIATAIAFIIALLVYNELKTWKPAVKEGFKVTLWSRGA